MWLEWHSLVLRLMPWLSCLSLSLISTIPAHSLFENTKSTTVRPSTVFRTVLTTITLGFPFLSIISNFFSRSSFQLKISDTSISFLPGCCIKKWRWFGFSSIICWSRKHTWRLWEIICFSFSLHKGKLKIVLVCFLELKVSCNWFCVFMVESVECS